MIVKKYIAVGMKMNCDYIKDIFINNNNNTISNNIIGMNYNIVTNKGLLTEWITDHKHFDSKKEVVNHIFKNLKTDYNRYSEVMHWTVMKTYVDVTDLLEQRRYKIKKLVKKFKKKKSILV